MFCLLENHFVFFYSSKTAASEGFHYSDFDCKVMDYMGRLSREDTAKTYISQTRAMR